MKLHNLDSALLEKTLKKGLVVRLDYENINEYVSSLTNYFLDFILFKGKLAVLSTYDTNEIESLTFVGQMTFSDNYKHALPFHSAVELVKHEYEFMDSDYDISISTLSLKKEKYLIEALNKYEESMSIVELDSI